MEKKVNYEVRCWIMGVVIVLLSGLLLAALFQIKNILPARRGLQGFFQSIPGENNLITHRANFDSRNNNFYYISYTRNDELISKGTYEKKEDNLYVLTDEGGEKTLVVLLHDKFYYYDKKTDEIITLVSIGDGSPPSIGIEPPDIPREE